MSINYKESIQGKTKKQAKLINSILIKLKGKISPPLNKKKNLKT